MSFPDVIDSTMLISFRSCQKKFEYNFLHSLRKPGLSIHLDFGGAFAKGIEAARKSFFTLGQSHNEAVAAALNAAWGEYKDESAIFFPDTKSAKGLGTLLLAIEEYFKQWPLGDDGLIPMPGGGIEFSFAIPIPNLLHPDHGGPIFYGGRFDCAGMYLGMPTVVDEKTTSSFSENWISQWALRNQFLGYIWGAQTYGFAAQQALVRGVAIQKKEIKFMQALISFPNYMIERFYAQMLSDVEAMIRVYKANAFGLNFGDTCSAYGGCVYQDLCKAKVPSEWFSAFVEQKWEPLKAREDAA